MRSRAPILAFIVICCCPAVFAADGPVGGVRLADFLESLNTVERRIIFSSGLVSDDFLVSGEPIEGDLQSGLERVLKPFGLTIRKGPSGSLLVVRLADAPPTKALTPEVDELPLPEIIVTSSLQRLQYTQPGNQTYLDRELATRIPAAAEEAVRLPNRLPAIASGGISTRSHVRGGEANETLYLLDGLRLYEPFHLKDFQSIATTINSAAIEGMDFFSGAFPARYGDRMSGVLDMSLREPAKPVETELSLSFFNASAMSLGTFGDDEEGDWLLAARRGNLDLIVDVVDPEFGNPDYQDYLGHVGWVFGPRADISLNMMLSNDKLQLNLTDRGETAMARYNNQVVWARWVANWSKQLQSETIVSITDIENTRHGFVDLPGIVSGSLDDERNFRAAVFKQDWVYVPSDRWMIAFGVDAKHVDGNYLFSSVKAVAEPFDQILDNEPLQTLDFDIVADGAQYAAYVEARWSLQDRLTVDVGMRWDYQSYTTANDDTQSSPRISLLYDLADNTELRVGWGQYSQAQEVNELQVSDGNDAFFPAQRAEHIVLNLKHYFPAGTNVDISFFRKKFRAVRPRYENVFNQLTIVPELQFDRVMIDADSAESRGAELLISRGSGGDELFWWLGYAWSKVEDTLPSGKQKRSWDQTHTIKLGASWRWGKWDFSVAGEGHTGWPRTLITSRHLFDQRYSVYHALDARVSRDIDLQRGNLKLFLEVTNLYDRQNECCTEYSLSADGELVSRNAHWLPLVPSLGFVWTF